MSALLGVNIDHVATLRQARGTCYPDTVEAALMAEQAGADGITVHLREDRRHIQDHDVERVKEAINTRLNLEMAVTDEMVAIAERIKPAYVCLVPEKREELTTEGGLDVISNQSKITEACTRLAEQNIKVSLFIDADPAQIDASVACGAPYIELHTGHYADAVDEATRASELAKIQSGVQHGVSVGLTVNAGHGLHLDNVGDIAAIDSVYELNIGHSLIARAVFVGLAEAVLEMKAAMAR